MLTIRNEQMAALADGAWDRLGARASVALLEDAAEQLDGLPRQVAQGRVAWAVRRARTQGFTDYGSVIAFATCLLEFGPAFERHPVVARLLAPAATSAEARLNKLLDGLPSYVWSELDMIRNDTDWRDIGVAAHLDS